MLPSLSVLEDPQFTALSVTAHHWLKISEVSPPNVFCKHCSFDIKPRADIFSLCCVQVRLPQLSSYLLAKREEGYRLVGAEQTAHSKSLTSYPFQPRTVLLLGWVCGVAHIPHSALSYCWGGYAVLPISHTLHCPTAGVGMRCCPYPTLCTVLLLGWVCGVAHIPHSALSYCWGGYAVLPISHTLHSAPIPYELLPSVSP